MLELGEDVVEDGEEETFGLARSGARDHGVVASRNGIANRLFLVFVELAMGVKSPEITVAEREHASAQQPFLD